MNDVYTAPRDREIEATEAKAYRIIWSCTQRAHLMTARRYCENFAMRFSEQQGQFMPGLLAALDKKETAIAHGLSHV